ncbi:hypothetical protein GFB56_01290 [Ensifer sp. T173]|uniref:Transposase n=1 Tax=Ensifer canadensis TaxID=555315 RepID=A0AAW4FEK0_9HYPH|nr:hypothetical protein [Ensifer canadensis]
MRSGFPPGNAKNQRNRTLQWLRLGRSAQLHVSLNPIRFKDKNMQQFKELQRPLRV